METGLKGNSRRPTGRWYPVSRLSAYGETYSDSEFDSEELEQIAAALDEKIGDIRNYIDQELTARRELAGGVGFVGGADAIQHVDPEPVMRTVSNSLIAHNNRQPYGYNAAANGYPAYTSAYGAWLLGHLSNIKESAKRRRRGLLGLFNHGDERA